MELVWSSLAKEQLRNVLSYVEEEYGYRIAQKTLLNISQKVNQLLSYPERGILDAKLSSLSFSDNYVIRHILVLPNVIYYIVKNNSVIIIAIAHTKQSPSTIRKMLKAFLRQNKE